MWCADERAEAAPGKLPPPKSQRKAAPTRSFVDQRRSAGQSLFLEAHLRRVMTASAAAPNSRPTGGAGTGWPLLPPDPPVLLHPDELGG